MKIRRIAAVLAAAALSAACLAGTAFADGGAAVSVSDTEARTADGKTTATVEVSLSGNPGFGALDAQLEYDGSKLRLESVSKGGLCGGGLFVGNPGNGKVSFAAVENVTGDGVLFTATFEVLAGAPDGDVDVPVSVKVTNLANTDVENVPFSTSAGKVTVRHQHSYAGAWSLDASGHWHECACGARSGEDVHDFSGELVVDEAADYGKEGSGHRVCSACGAESAPEVIPALHRCEFSEEWSCDESGHWHACAHEGCSEKGSFAEHDLGEWAAAEGDMLPAGAASAEVRVCSVCGWAEYRDVVSVGEPDAAGDAEGADGADGAAAAGSASASGKGGLSQTGDPLGAAAAVVAAAALASGAAVVALRRRNAA